MNFSEIAEATPSRIRWLCAASKDAAHQLCSSPDIADPLEVHCARFSLHLASGVVLPPEYAWEILKSGEYRSGRNAYTAPRPGHLLTMAMYAADFDNPVPDFTELLERKTALGIPYNPDLERAVIFRYANAPAAIDDERLRELSANEDREIRRAIARILKFRDSPYRNEILIRLMDDPDRKVSYAASSTAGSIGNAALSDLLVARGDLFILSFKGDPRTRPRVEALVSNVTAADVEEVAAVAVALGDLNLINKLLTNPEWGVRVDSILCSAGYGRIGPTELRSILANESTDHLAELTLRWPYTREATLGLVSERLPDRVKNISFEAPKAGYRDAFDPDAFSALELGAALRLLPEEEAASLAHVLLESASADKRAVAVNAVGYRRLTSCFPRVAEACLDVDPAVAEAAARSIAFARMRCGLFGLDTAILAAAKYPSFRIDLWRLIESILDNGDKGAR